MIPVYILTAHLAGGFSMMPFDTESACQAALESLAIVTEAECYPIEMIIPSGSRFAPSLAPLPPRKPERSA